MIRSVDVGLCFRPPLGACWRGHVMVVGTTASLLSLHCRLGRRASGCRYSLVQDLAWLPHLQVRKIVPHPSEGRGVGPFLGSLGVPVGLVPLRHDLLPGVTQPCQDSPVGTSDVTALYFHGSPGSLIIWPQSVGIMAEFASPKDADTFATFKEDVVLFNVILKPVCFH